MTDKAGPGRPPSQPGQRIAMAVVANPVTTVPAQKKRVVGVKARGIEMESSAVFGSGAGSFGATNTGTEAGVLASRQVPGTLVESANLPER
jgi:hypothetical protein